MTVLRLTQETIETLTQADPKARLTQAAVVFCMTYKRFAKEEAI